MSYFIPLFGNGRSKFQPVFIDDVSLLVEKIVKYNLVGNHIFEAGGPNILSYRELYYLISKFMDKKRVLIPLPMKIVKVLVRIAEIFPFSPINLEQLSLFEKDNVGKKVDKDFNYLEITPQNTIGIRSKTVKN
jgi:NADH dehydrogenase